MPITGKEYDDMTKKASPPSPVLKNVIKAFFVGGVICTLGELLSYLYGMTSMNEKEVKALVPITLIVLTAILTGLGIFDRIARHGGAGTIVPITGFANSVVAPALEFQSEGRIMGTGVQMFTIAGPVIVYGTAAAALYGLIVFLFHLY